MLTVMTEACAVVILLLSTSMVEKVASLPFVIFWKQVYATFTFIASNSFKQLNEYNYD